MISKNSKIKLRLEMRVAVVLQDETLLKRC